ncbi:MAG: cell wall-binding repeat-containing protein, partial [Tissierellia bacterium]|nr:cell wall-binding repeat-containing protein [Tissierellia bacterium]
IIRVAGINRYETSYEIAKRNKKENIVFASGENFPDALASAAFAKSVNANLVLLGKVFTAQNQELVNESLKNYVVGGKVAIDPDLIPADKTIIAGDNRYQTSTLIADTL